MDKTFTFQPTSFEGDVLVNETNQSGLWFRQGRSIVVLLDDRAHPGESELSSGFPRSVLLFPPKRSGAAAIPPTLPVPLFPPKAADPLTADSKMELALKSAIAKLEKDHKLNPGSFPVRFTLADVTNASGAYPSGRPP